MCTFLYEAMAQDDKLTERKVITVGKDDCHFGAVCFSERTFVILATMAKDEDVHARDFARILHAISFFRSRDYCVIARETVSFL